MSDQLVASIKASITTGGPMRFADFVELALYDTAHGFYAASGRAGGRTGDFVTSVEAGPLFAAVVGDWLDRAWIEAGRPTAFHVAEVGAGVGTLFRGICHAAPACLESITYTLVERSSSQRLAHETLPTNHWRSAAELPEQHQHVVLANELLDNLTFDIGERTETGWARVHVALSDDELGLHATVDDETLDYLTALAPNAAVGDRVPIATGARSWLASTQDNADRLLIFDYGASTAELAERGQHGWLRTYADHTRGSDPLIDIGRRDITCDVPFDQLPHPDSAQLQAEWLHENGLADRVAQARSVWTERGHIGDLAAMRARSAIGEAEALTDPTGLGSFVVLTWRPHG